MFEMLGGDKKKLVMYAFLAILLFFIISKKSEAKRIEVPTKVVDEEQHVKVVQEEQSAKVVQEEQPKKVVQEEQPRKVVQEEQNVTEKFNNKQKTKATLYWASWCGHCQMTKPKWMEMKEHFKNSENIQIEEVNCEGENARKCIVLNEQGKPDHVRGYPTMVVRKLNNKNLIVKEVEYRPTSDGKIKGDRSVNDLINFVNHYNTTL
jgi:thiol-disulfide isomerase/thioredoxin